MDNLNNQWKDQVLKATWLTRAVFESWKTGAKGKPMQWAKKLLRWADDAQLDFVNRAKKEAAILAAKTLNAQEIERVAYRAVSQSSELRKRNETLENEARLRDAELEVERKKRERQDLEIAKLREANKKNQAEFETKMSKLKVERVLGLLSPLLLGVVVVTWLGLVFWVRCCRRLLFGLQIVRSSHDQWSVVTIGVVSCKYGVKGSDICHAHAHSFSQDEFDRGRSEEAHAREVCEPADLDESVMSSHVM